MKAVIEHHQPHGNGTQTLVIRAKPLVSLHLSPDVLDDVGAQFEPSAPLSSAPLTRVLSLKRR